MEELNRPSYYHLVNTCTIHLFILIKYLTPHKRNVFQLDISTFLLSTDRFHCQVLVISCMAVACTDKNLPTFQSRGVLSSTFNISCGSYSSKQTKMSSNMTCLHFNLEELPYLPSEFILFQSIIRF